MTKTTFRACSEYLMGLERKATGLFSVVQWLKEVMAWLTENLHGHPVLDIFSTVF